MVNSSYRTDVGQFSVLLLGGILLFLSVGFMLDGRTVRLIDFLRVAVPVALSLCVVALGVWLQQSHLSGSRIARVFGFCLTGGVATLAVTGWIFVLETFSGRVTGNVGFILLNGGTVGVVVGGLFGVSYDQLAHRRRQLAEQAYRLDEFANVVSHDLRNPLNIAQGHLDIARETGANRHFDAIEHSMCRMERLTREILALAQHRVDAGSVQSVPVDEAARAAWTDVESDAGTLQMRTNRTVEADSQRLQTLLQNVFRNAVDHGGADVTVTVTGLPDGIAIEDDGPGIPLDSREQVFEGGYSTGGRPGFGLAIVRCIADAHGWDHRFTEPETETTGARFELSGF